MTIAVQCVTFGYAGSAPLLDGADFSVSQGETVLLAGRNGAGKSTMLKLLNGILKPTGGRILVNGQDTASTSTASLASQLTVTFQNPADQIFASTVREEVLFGPKTLRRADPGRLAEECLEMFGLLPFARRHPYDLSPAHRKLLTLASALASDSPILAFDEPTASLSQTERTTLLKAWDRLRTLHRTIVVVSHDFGFFLPLVSRVLVLADRTIRHSVGPAEFVSDRRIARSGGLELPVTIRLGGYEN